MVPVYRCTLCAWQSLAVSVPHQILQLLQGHRIIYPRYMERYICTWKGHPEKQPSGPPEAEPNTVSDAREKST